MLSIRTDLALESVYTHQHEGITQAQTNYNGVAVTEIEITSQEASDLVGKPMGKFITMETDSFFETEPEKLEQNANLLAKMLGKLLPASFDKILVVGLGNRNITPDALGPCVLDRIMVTNHIMEYLNTDGNSDFRAVGAVSPGVMGVTGLETVEIVKGVVERYQPSVVIAVDALCAATPGRMFTTVQLTDTGIHPGSGVGNRRDGLNRETLGVPVIAVGIPTVVDSHAIVHSALTGFFEANHSLKDADQMISGMMQHVDTKLFVSPKDIDNLIAKSARAVAGGINLALHRNIDLSYAENFVS
ncbi:MAG: GPR endopeptidase [Clostridia bacterium]|nr:GPR endopeptidase [Clostridia bacterium]